MGKHGIKKASVLNWHQQLTNQIKERLEDDLNWKKFIQKISSRRIVRTWKVQNQITNSG